MLDVFCLIFVVDTETIFRYDFVAPLNIEPKKSWVWSCFFWNFFGVHIVINISESLSFLLLFMEKLSREKSTSRMNFRVYANVIMVAVKS